MMREPYSEENAVPHAAMSPNHVAVVTGGASGIGLAAAMRFAQFGMKVCIADLGADRLEEAATKLSSVAPGGADSIMTVAVDVSRVDDVTALQPGGKAVRRHRYPDEQCRHRPGSTAFGPLENWQRILAVNLWGVIHGTQAFAPA